MAINPRTPFIACQAAVPIRIEQGGGSIINVSSHAATNIFLSTLGEDREGGMPHWQGLREPPRRGRSSLPGAKAGDRTTQPSTP